MMGSRIGSFLFVLIIFLILLVHTSPSALADTSATLTVIYSGEEGGQIGLHGCGTEQVGGLSRRQTVIHSLREQYASPLNLHTGTLTDPTDPNNELIYQIALEAVSAMNYDAVCLGPQALYLPVDALSALYANHPNLPVVCTNLSGADLNSLSLAPYIIVQNRATQTRVAVIGLISQSHRAELNAYNPDITLTDPEAMLQTSSFSNSACQDTIIPGVLAPPVVANQPTVVKFRSFVITNEVGSRVREASVPVPELSSARLEACLVFDTDRCFKTGKAQDF